MQWCGVTWCSVALGVVLCVLRPCFVCPRVCRCVRCLYICVVHRYVGCVKPRGAYSSAGESAFVAQAVNIDGALLIEARVN